MPVSSTERTNERWVADLRAAGEASEQAVGELRGLVRRLLAAQLVKRGKFDESLLDDATLVDVLVSGRGIGSIPVDARNGRTDEAGRFRIGDLNDDGLPEVFISGGPVENRLYLNASKTKELFIVKIKNG